MWGHFVLWSFSTRDHGLDWSNNRWVNKSRFEAWFSHFSASLSTGHLWQKLLSTWRCNWGVLFTLKCWQIFSNSLFRDASQEINFHCLWVIGGQGSVYLHWRSQWMEQYIFISTHFLCSVSTKACKERIL